MVNTATAFGIPADITATITSQPISTTDAQQIPTSLGRILNTAIAANTNAFSTALTTTANRMKIWVCVSAAAALSVIRTNGTNTLTETLNGGTNLIGGALYEFDIDVWGADTINIQFGAAVTITELTVESVQAVVGA